MASSSSYTSSEVEVSLDWAMTTCSGWVTESGSSV